MKRILSTVPPSSRRSCGVLVLGAVALSTLSSGVQARDEFNLYALEIDNPMSVPKDLSMFSDPGGQAPGTYRVDVYMNGELQDTQDIIFVAGSDGKLVPQLTPAQLDEWGVKLAAAPALQGVDKGKVITDLPLYIPQATTRFDFSLQRLELTVPQALMDLTARGAVDPKYWDEGVPALMTSYQFSGGNSWQRGQSDSGRSDNYFLGLRSGANLGAWRLRNNSVWSAYKDSKGETQQHWNSNETYLQRDVPPVEGQLTLGDSYTPSDVFDSVQFRGAQLASDDSMLPDSMRGFAPTVRGIANSNARVTVKQNGAVIYQTYVPPGAFVLNDLYPTASSGDLTVTITEADGRERSFVQPFSSVPMMQREGRLKYAFTVGKYRSSSQYNDEPVLGQLSMLYGLPRDLTIYGGFQTSHLYNSLALGLGVSLGGIGSLAADVKQAYTTMSDGKSQKGQSYGFQYSKAVLDTGSTLTLAAYRYSTEGYYTFNEALNYKSESEGYFFNSRYNQRTKLQVNFSQTLRDWGSLSLTAYQRDFWNTPGTERNISVGYNNSWDNITYGVAYTYSKQPFGEGNDQQVALNVSIPLDRWLPRAWANASVMHSKGGATTYQTGISGTALEDNNLSYSLSEGYGTRGVGNSGSTSATYQGRLATVRGGYNYSPNNRQVNYGIDGAVVVHPNGITLSQPLSGNAPIAIVRAPGAAGAKVMNNTGVRTDWRGYAVVPYLTPYRRSQVSLDPASLPEDVDMDGNVKSVVPTSGAVVVADYKTRIGLRVLMTLMKGGQPVPFGATVSLVGESGSSGIVGDGGQVYLSGVPQSGSVLAKWGSGASQQCRASFSLPGQTSGAMPAQTQMQCL
ncbi:fimbria/pilus outer membrane usher protein [Serratia sp. OS31]|uniref:fimbria/pilus outer membrane usher protein n=1 Tax=Serratia sp. OS31 TaxID=2760844 RepID=UPI001602ADA3|nr:fimbria/pilus outer membrane usher protein [Serratia sp. OS31]MBB1585007.1 fimbrial biogenesis outer membrane usher protein [Serratia sp. OS31]